MPINVGKTILAYSDSVPLEFRPRFESDLEGKYRQYYRIFYIIAFFGEIIFIPSDVLSLKIPLSFSVAFRLGVMFPMTLAFYQNLDRKFLPFSNATLFAFLAGASELMIVAFIGMSTEVIRLSYAVPFFIISFLVGIVPTHGQRQLAVFFAVTMGLFSSIYFLVDGIDFGLFAIGFLLLSLSIFSIYLVYLHNRRSEESQWLLQHELKEAKERAEQATAQKNKFVSLVSHDIRGPLGTIRGFATLSLENKNPDGSFGPHIEHFLKTILDVAQGLIDTTQKLLDISRFQTGKISPKMEPFRVRPLMDEIIALSSFRAKEKGVTVINELAQDLNLFGDEELIGQAALNLLSNAVKFSKTGDVMTIYSPTPRVVAFRDTGPGIAPSFLPDIFKHDVRTTTPGTEGEKGTGLGLPYCLEIMKAHGGDIKVETSPKGTAIYLEFSKSPHDAAR